MAGTQTMSDDKGGKTLSSVGWRGRPNRSNRSLVSLLVINIISLRIPSPPSFLALFVFFGDEEEVPNAPLAKQRDDDDDGFCCRDEITTKPLRHREWE